CFVLGLEYLPTQTHVCTRSEAGEWPGRCVPAFGGSVMTARTRRVLVLLTASMALCAIAVAAQPRRPDLDTRLPEDERSRGGFTMRMQTLDQQRVAERLARIEPGLTLRWNGLSGSPKWIAARPERTLSTPSGTTPEERARGWMRGNASLFGLDPEEIDALRTIVRAPAQ